MIRSIVFTLLVAGPVAVPDGLPPLPPDGSVCNEAGTHCLVNYDDWMELHQEIADLRARVKTVKCASVTVTEPSKLTRR